MKPIVYFICSVFIFLSSCTEKSEHVYNKVDANLKIDILISAIDSDASKSEAILPVREIPFSGTSDLRLSEIIKPARETRTIQSVTPAHGAILSISEIVDENEITSLQFNWGFKALNEMDYSMMESIDLLAMDHQITDGVFKFNFDEVADLLIDKINKADMMLRFNITGNSNSNLNGIANLEIPVVIETEVFSPRFELF